MPLHLSLFGLFSPEPLPGLLDHYELIAKSLSVLDQSLKVYLSTACTKSFQVLTEEMNRLEEEADKIKRRIRKRLPSAFFMVVDKSMFLMYTRHQDNILDSAQEAMNWLSMRPMVIPETYHPGLRDITSQVMSTVSLLRPALQESVELIRNRKKDQTASKEKYRLVRKQHFKVAKAKMQLVTSIYNSSLEFKDIFQLISYINCLHEMSHNSEGCADVLRAMMGPFLKKT